MTKKMPGACPSCGSTQTARIGYGYPSDEMIAAAERGEVAIGGCIVSDNDPKYSCRECYRAWGQPRVELTSRFERALVLAAQLHRDQVRKDTLIPYVSHLLGAASLVLEASGGEDEAIAALLHDAIEDQGGLVAHMQIAQEFGDSVAVIVAACSDSEVMPKPPWRERKEHHLAALKTAPYSVLLVTAADKLHNLRSILADVRIAGPAVFARFTAGQEGTLWYYGEIAALLGKSKVKKLSLVAELQATLAELRREIGVDSK